MSGFLFKNALPSVRTKKRKFARKSLQRHDISWLRTPESPKEIPERLHCEGRHDKERGLSEEERRFIVSEWIRTIQMPQMNPRCRIRNSLSPSHRTSSSALIALDFLRN